MLEIDLAAVLSSLVAGELARIRNCSELEAALVELKPSTEIADHSLGIDSLGLLQIASAVSQMFHLHETGVDEYLLRYRKLADWAEIVSVSLKKKAECITFRTSGSSGKPKPCVHRVTDLQQEVDVHAGHFTECRRVITVVPRHHIYGFIWTVMLPAQLGVEVLDARALTPYRLAEQMREGDLLVGTPATWRHLSSELDCFPASLMAITSGAPCSDSLFSELQGQGLRVTEIYGSSETAGIGIRDAPGRPFELLPFWNRLPCPNMLSSAQGMACHHTMQELQTLGGLGVPVVREFLGRKSVESGDLREMEIPDCLEWCDDKRFFVGGRKDNAVQVLGTNVFPEQVADVIRSHAYVKECAVRLMRPSEGHHLKAFIVTHNQIASQLAGSELMTWLRGQLQPHQRPASIVIGSELPRNEMGKLKDWDCR